MKPRPAGSISASPDPAALRPLLVPRPPEQLRVWPLSPAVNRPGAEGPERLAPIGRPAG